MKLLIIFCLLILVSLSPALVLANEGTIPEPVLPLMLQDVAFTPTGEAVSVQVGLSDWDNGITAATLTFKSLSAGDSITLTYGSTDEIYSDTNTTWLVNELHADPGTWSLRQVYARDGEGRELNLFFQGEFYSFTVAEPDQPAAPLPQYTIYLPQVRN